MAAGLVVVIPALNEGPRLAHVVASVVARGLPVVVVDDGSSDGSTARGFGPWVEVLRHPHRLGKGEALKTGFRRAGARGARAVMTMDGDGQHSAEDIPALLAAERAYPGRIVIGARLRSREQQPTLRRFGNEVADWAISWAAGQAVADSQSGHRIYPRRALELAARSPAGGFAFEADVLIRAAREGIGWVLVPIAARYAFERRASHFAPIQDVVRIVRVVASRILRDGSMLANWRRMHASGPLIVGESRAAALRMRERALGGG